MAASPSPSHRSPRPARTDRCGVERQLQDSLGRHIVCRPHRAPGNRRAPEDEFARVGLHEAAREPEIEHFYLSIAADEDIAGLDVAVDDAGGVGGVERLRYLSAISMISCVGSDPRAMCSLRFAPSTRSIAMKAVPSWLSIS